MRQTVDTDSVVFLLNQLIKNVKKQNDWEKWVDENEWDNEDVKWCLEEAIRRVKHFGRE